MFFLFSMMEYVGDVWFWAWCGLTEEGSDEDSGWTHSWRKIEKCYQERFSEKTTWVNIYHHHECRREMRLQLCFVIQAWQKVLEMDEVEVHVNLQKWFLMRFWADHILEREMLLLGVIWKKTTLIHIPEIQSERKDVVVVWCSSRTGMHLELEGRSKWVSDGWDKDSCIKLLKGLWSTWKGGLPVVAVDRNDTLVTYSLLRVLSRFSGWMGSVELHQMNRLHTHMNICMSISSVTC